MVSPSLSVRVRINLGIGLKNVLCNFTIGAVKCLNDMCCKVPIMSQNIGAVKYLWCHINWCCKSSCLEEMASMMQHHVEIHSDWISCRLTTMGPTVVWHLSASEVLSRSWRHSKWGGACAHVAQRTPCIQIHCTEFDLTWQCLRSCHCEITCVYLHPEAATAPAWSCYRHIYDIYDCSYSHIGSVPKPKTFSAPKYIRETLQTSCLC